MPSNISLESASLAVWCDLKRIGASALDLSSPDGGTVYTFRLQATPQPDCAVTVTVHVTAVAGEPATVSVEVPPVTLEGSDLAYFGDVVSIACTAAARAQATLDAVGDKDS